MHAHPQERAPRLRPVFNLSGSEMVFLLLIALVVLGPEKLPEAVRKFGKIYGDLKKMSNGFQSELRDALDEPMKEMRETADTLRQAVSMDFEPERPDPAAAGDAAALSSSAPSPESPSSAGGIAVGDATDSPHDAKPAVPDDIAPMLPDDAVPDQGPER